MKVWLSKICALALAVVLMPGALEVLENTTHLAIEGHLAHAEGTGDRHEPSGSEHGCTLIFHACGCHASLVFLGSQTPPAIDLHAAGFSGRPALDPQLTGFWPSIDRPPQV